MKPAFAGAFASAGGFIAGYLVPSMLFVLGHHLSRAPSTDGSASALDVYVVMLNISLVYALVGAIAFAAVAAASRNWLQRPLRQVAAISALAGVPACILHWTGLSMIAVLPLVHVMPQNLASLIGVTMPGVVAGLAVLLWSAMRGRTGTLRRETK